MTKRRTKNNKRSKKNKNKTRRKYKGGRIRRDLNTLLKGVETIFLRYPPSIDQEFLDYFDSISKEDIKFSITSNTAFISGSIIQKFLKNINLLDKFNFCLFSDEVGYGKPNRKIYECLYSKSKDYHSSISKIEIIHIGMLHFDLNISFFILFLVLF